ncbi:hypothetical protein Xen7305DRAFT_00035030 [Xenococcus sp. PCC 7305]|uniref:hypothetical protein n=1 Tax=Xenococcus sp. PCC 7305 TaxID=102125 RepID=UPI0002AD0C1A|nr:hypothetical protein [Xenococcus sp. PCC 7305]ELS03779.1 hypothetical protein Xen7305DRAFT_00035030 [Xenococcus sp. PCC 7305]
MTNVSSGLPVEKIGEHHKVNPHPANVEFQDWINYHELAFDCLSLGEVVYLLECLKKEVESTEVSDISASIVFPKTKKQRMIAKWNNMLTVAHIKSFVGSFKERLAMLVT